ncbi:MAG: hypothetical protein RLZ25_1690 [Pseudomonadota bacterium]
MPSSLPVFIVGCGDIGLRLARRLRAEGIPVAALARSPLRAQTLETEGITPFLGDLDESTPALTLPGGIQTLYYLAPPPPAGPGDPRMRHGLAALQTVPKRLIYISTSGVYGDCEGAWIDEEAPLKPKTDRARRRVEAERLVKDYAERTGCEVLVLRVPGIYGDGRLPETRIRQGLPVIDPHEAPFSNRIHADDLAEACIRARTSGIPGHAYNISDGHPSTMTDYFWQVADHLGLPRPPAIPLAEAREVLTPAMLSFMEESKRLDNRRMREELGVVLRYPTLQDGLNAVFLNAAPLSD